MIQILTASMFILSSIYGGPTIVSDTNTISSTTEPMVKQRVEEKATSEIPTKKELEQKAKVYFKDDPILVEIARCESQFRHLDKDGEILKGKVNRVIWALCR